MKQVKSFEQGLMLMQSWGLVKKRNKEVQYVSKGNKGEFSCKNYWGKVILQISLGKEVGCDLPVNLMI